MLASVVTTFREPEGELESLLTELRAHRCIEVGIHLPGNLRVPMVLDAETSDELESLTRYLQSHPAISFVDVVMVQYE
ncbi:MAG: hypothetical protein CMJ46_12210 [Planctomyces sp.]|nr:hypothetical protein [Planctomyces sp.]